MTSKRYTKVKIRAIKRRRLEYLFNKNVIGKLRKWQEESRSLKKPNDYLKKPVKGFVFEDYYPISYKLLSKIKAEGMDRYIEECNRLLYEHELLKSA